MAPSQILADYKATGFSEPNEYDTVIAALQADLDNPGQYKATGFSEPNEYDTAIAALQADLDNPDQYKATGFNTVEPDPAGTAATLHTTTDAKIDVVDANVDSILEDTGTTIPDDISALNDITVADIIAGITDGSLDLQEMIRIILAAVAGKSSGGGTSTLKFQDAGDMKARITATVDLDGNRTEMVVDGA